MPMFAMSTDNNTTSQHTHLTRFNMDILIIFLVVFFVFSSVYLLINSLYTVISERVAIRRKYGRVYN